MQEENVLHGQKYNHIFKNIKGNPTTEHKQEQMFIFNLQLGIKGQLNLYVDF